MKISFEFADTINMDLTAAGVSAYQQAQYVNQAQVDVAAKTMNIARQQGTAALQLLQNATGITGGDPAAPAAPGLGGAIDAVA